MKRLRLVKVVVQAHFVIDDGETLEEPESQPIVVQPADWPRFSAETFPEQVAQFEANLNGEAS